MKNITAVGSRPWGGSAGPAVALVLAFVSWGLVATSPALADTNIWKGDLKRAHERLDAAQARYDAATRDIVAANSQLPAAEHAVDRLRPIANRAQRRATRANVRATRRERVEDDRRGRAVKLVRRLHHEHVAALATWRASRVRWVSVAAVLVALAIALALLAVVARARREGGVDRGRQANVAGVSLGVAVAVYLCGLLAALLWTDTFRYAGWPVAAALGGSAAMIAAVAMAWNASTRLAGPLTRLGRAAGVPVVAAALAALAPAAVAASDGRPAAHDAAAETQILAAQGREHAPYSLRTRHRRAIAERSSIRAADSSRRLTEAADEASRLRHELTDAQDRQGRAQIEIGKRGAEVADVQKDYDEYQQLLEDEAALDGDGSDSPDSALPPLNLPDDPGSDPDLGYPPTTEDFDSGTGSIGICADGTLSHSIGHQGACSYHGGVG